MNSVFPATLENGVIKWGPKGAPPLPANEPRQVEVIVAPAALPANPYSHLTLRELFEELARMDPLRDIDDPVEYIREMRRDRPLEGREE